MASPSQHALPLNSSNEGGAERNNQQPISPTQYQFSTEELRVLKQCNRDSFFQRSLPLGIGLGIGTFLGVQSGYLKGSARWGPTPKVVLAVTVGYFLGKFSYQTKCAEKIMQLPNSPLAEMLRRRKQQGKGGFQEALSMDPSFGAAITAVGPQDVYSDIGPRYDIDSPSDRPYQAGLNDSYRPTVDSSFIEEEPLPEIPPSHTTTYEELRRKNREEYEQKKTKPYSESSMSVDIKEPGDSWSFTSPPPPAVVQSPNATWTGDRTQAIGITGPDDIPSVIRPHSLQDPSSNKPKNQYGDAWDD